MKVAFDKYHGNGNDFIIVDGINNSLNHITQEKIKSLCDRNKGIGSDGSVSYTHLTLPTKRIV